MGWEAHNRLVVGVNFEHFLVVVVRDAINVLCLGVEALKGKTWYCLKYSFIVTASKPAGRLQ